MVFYNFSYAFYIKENGFLWKWPRAIFDKDLSCKAMLKGVRFLAFYNLLYLVVGTYVHSN